MVLGAGLAALGAATGAIVSLPTAFKGYAKALDPRLQTYTAAEAKDRGVARAQETGSQAEAGYYQGIADKSYERMMSSLSKGDVLGTAGSFGAGAAAQTPGVSRLVYPEGQNKNVRAAAQELVNRGYSHAEADKIARSGQFLTHAEASGTLSSALATEAVANLVGAGILNKFFGGASVFSKPAQETAKQAVKRVAVQTAKIGAATAPAGFYEGAVQDLLGQRAGKKIVKGKPEKIDVGRTAVSGSFGAATAAAAGAGISLVARAPGVAGKGGEFLGSTLLDPLEKPGDYVTAAGARLARGAGGFKVPVITPAGAPASIYSESEVQRKKRVQAQQAEAGKGTPISSLSPTEATIWSNVPTETDTGVPPPVDEDTTPPPPPPVDDKTPVPPAETDTQVPAAVPAAVPTGVPANVPVPLREGMPAPLPPLFGPGGGSGGVTRRGNKLYFNELKAARKALRGLM